MLAFIVYGHSTCPHPIHTPVSVWVICLPTTTHSVLDVNCSTCRELESIVHSPVPTTWKGKSSDAKRQRALLARCVARFAKRAAASAFARWQGLTPLPISAQLELFCPPYNPN